jgi:hypothetical protein
MEITQAFAQKLNSLDPTTRAQLDKLADDFNRANPNAQNPTAFNTAVMTFIRQRLPGSSPNTQKLVRLYIAYRRFGGGSAVRPAGGDPRQGQQFLMQELMQNMKLMTEILSNISKTRSEISMTFARNARA